MEEKENLQPERTGLEEKRRSAVLRYIAIMFAVAFVLVLVSLMGEMRHNTTAINELAQSSSSALQRAEQLQEENQQLQEENLALREQLEELTDRLNEVSAQKELDAHEAEKTLSKTKNNLLTAYEGLLTAWEQSLSGKAADGKELEHYEEYLGEKGKALLNRLLTEKEGE